MSEAEERSPLILSPFGTTEIPLGREFTIAPSVPRVNSEQTYRYLAPVYNFVIPDLEDVDGNLEIHRLNIENAVEDVLHDEQRSVFQIPPDTGFIGDATNEGIIRMLRNLPLSPIFNIHLLSAEEIKQLKLTMRYLEQDKPPKLYTGISQMYDQSQIDEDFHDISIEEWAEAEKNKGAAFIYPTAFNSIRWKITI